MAKHYTVKLDSFEGPLDLLLHLINELEIDLYDIPVAEITDQYMDFIHTMQLMDLNIASEYLVMAATLLEMKSAMLLPKQKIEFEDDYVEDPRESLMNRLVEYRKFKEAAQYMQDLELLENQIYTRGKMSLIEDSVPKIERESLSIYELIDALDHVFERIKWHAPVDTKISRTEISTEERMEEIVSLLKHKKEQVAFDELFPYATKQHVVSTFLAMLQLLKENQIQCNQEAQFKTIYVSWIGG